METNNISKPRQIPNTYEMELAEHDKITAMPNQYQC